MRSRVDWEYVSTFMFLFATTRSCAPYLEYHSYDIWSFKCQNQDDTIRIMVFP